MADDEANGDTGGDSDEVQHEKSQKKSAKYDSGAADLEKVTDYAEEKEICSADLSGAMTIIGDRRNKEAAEKMAKERELLKVSIRKDDVDLIEQKMGKYKLQDKLIKKAKEVAKRAFSKDIEVELCKNLWQRDEKVLKLTDTAPCKILAFMTLKALYPNMMHVTCCAHAWHRIAEKKQGMQHKWMREMEISRNLAERTLREHHGNVVEALISLTD